MKTILFSFISLILSIPLLSYAQEPQRINKDLENISGQYAECTAYYELVSHAMKSSNDPKTAGAYSEIGNTAMFYSLLLANEGRAKDVAVQVTNSRIDMYKKKMKQEADNRNENISILINKYHFGCQQAMENPSDKLTAILSKKLEEVDKQPEPK
jgi:hypothetical protein